MNRIRVFRTVLAISVICAVAVMFLPATAAEQVQRPKQAVPLVLSTAQIVSAQFSCGSTSTSNFTATVKNIGKAEAFFVGTLTMTAKGACLHTDSTKNPDGTPCKPDQMFCPGYCTQWAPDTTTAANFAPTKIAAGATATLSVTVPNKDIKSAVLKVMEQGKTTGATKKLGAFSTCIF